MFDFRNHPAFAAIRRVAIDNPDCQRIDINKDDYEELFGPHPDMGFHGECRVDGVLIRPSFSVGRGEAVNVTLDTAAE